MTNIFLTRRAVLAGSATLPALHLPAPAAAAEPDDPAIGAALRWFDADERMRAYRCAAIEPDPRDPHGLEDFPVTRALADRRDDAFWAMATTPPTTAAGLALTLAAYGFARVSCDVRSRCTDPETWRNADDDERTLLLVNAWASAPLRALMAGRART